MSKVFFAKELSGVEQDLQVLLGKSSEEIKIGLKKKFKDFLYGKITEDTYWKSVIEDAEWNVDVQTLKKIVRKHIKPIEGTLDIIKKLKGQGYILGLLSGHTKEWIAYTEKKYGYEKYFDYVLYSFQVGYNKPDIRIYHKMLDMIKENPEELVFIDDKEEFLEPAKNLGMKVIHFENPEQLKKELASLEISI